MKAPPLLDTNILVYALIDDPRTPRAIELVREPYCLSVQGLNELAHLGLRKLAWPAKKVQTGITEYSLLARTVVVLDAATNAEAIDLAARYRLAFHDALMLAAALMAGSTIAYTEDMHHGLVIDGRLTVVNPFRQHSA